MASSIKTNYLALSLRQRKEVTELIIDLIKKKNLEEEFDAIAFSGMSGALYAIPVANALNKELLIVRKKEGHHSGMKMEGYYSTSNDARYIIIDDFTDSGTTLVRIIDAIKSVTSEPPVCIILYSQYLSVVHREITKYPIHLLGQF